MLLISFNIGKQRYALKCGMVVEITPIVELMPIPLAEKFITGIFNYRGTPIPVIDLCQLYNGYPSKTQMSTRIIIIRYKGKNEHTNLLGLIAERVTESLNDDNLEFMESGIHIANAPFLGPVANDEHGMIQMVDTEQLLSDSIAGSIFTEQSATVA